MLTAERIAANRRNAQHSTGPKTAEGKARSRANALTHGMAATTIVPPDDEALFEERLADWTQTFEPQGPVEEVLVRTAVFASVKLERCSRAEFAQAAQSRRETMATWEAEQAQRVSQILTVFDDQPATAVNQLESFCAGCDWLVSAWRDLLEQGPTPAEWTEDHFAHAERLLGLETVNGRVAGTSHEELRACLRGPERALLIEAELDRLMALRDELWEQQDGPALVEAINLAALDTSPQGALRHRYQVASFKQFFRSLVRLERGRRDASSPSRPGMASLQRLAASRREMGAANRATAEPPAPEPTPIPNEAKAPQDEERVASSDNLRRPPQPAAQNEATHARHMRRVASTSHPMGAHLEVQHAAHECSETINAFA